MCKYIILKGTDVNKYIMIKGKVCLEKVYIQIL